MMNFIFKFLLISNLWFVSYISITSAYNLDTDNVRIYSDPTILNHRRGSYFGFSTALLVNDKNPAVLIGAPRANTTSLQNVIEPGTVYQCHVNGQCDEWVVDSKEYGRVIENPTTYRNRDNAWTGATIAVENSTQPRVVVCAPRWKINIIKKYGPAWYMNGICYQKKVINADSFKTEADDTLAPLLSTSEQTINSGGVYVYNFGMGQAGFSLSMISNDLRWDIALGCPGIYNWKGAPVLNTKSVWGEVETIIPQTRDERRIRSDSYFGYSITSGAYFQKGEYLYASAAPRAVDVHGKVLIFSFPRVTKRTLSIRKTLDGQKVGEYFGAALSSCDLNGDGKDELIVGAPTWSKHVDEGRIYVFTSRYNENFETQIYEGEAPGGRFGLMITCLGDIDYDGYADLAIGAPYENESGAIYIFNGNNNGLPKTYSQRIVGSQFGEGIRGFGISISEPRDINRDNYLDIAVGAYLSEQVVLIRSKPVVILNVKLDYTERKKLLSNSTYFPINMCMSYDGPYAPEQLRINNILKVDQMYRRATYNGKNSNNGSYKLSDVLHKAQSVCSQIQINLKENIQNIDPIEISASVTLDDSNKVEDEGSFSCASCAVVNKLLSKTEDFLKLPFAIDCGDDDICTSDVKLMLSTDLKSGNRYIIGSTSTVKLSINISNDGEPAYQAKVHIYIPRILSLASVPTECMESSYVNGTIEVICDVGNPLRKSENVVVEVDMTGVKYGVDHIEFKANVTTHSEEKNVLDNTFNLTMYLDADIDIAIAGKAQENLYSYLDKEDNKQLNNIQFQHIYEVQKFGASPIDEAVLMINVPVSWKQSIGNVPIMNIDRTVAYMEGQQFYCTYSNYTGTSMFSESIRLTPPVYSKAESTHEKFTIEENPSINLPPYNRSLYLNCSSEIIECKTVECKLGPFLSSLSVARISLILDLQLSNLRPEMEEKDIIFVVTDGYVYITQPQNVKQKVGHKLDNATVATTFVGSPIAQPVATWIIVLSVFLGIILLILLILGLIKLGFFHRKKKEELEALKTESDRAHGIVLETSSSQEVLDQE